MTDRPTPDQILEALTDLAGVARGATDLRNKRIIQARHAGIPIRTVAQAAGVSHQTIVNIINRTKKAHP